MYFAILRDLAATNMSPVCLRQCWNHRSRIDGCAGRFLQQPVSQGRALDLSTRGVARGNLEFNWPPSDRPDAGQKPGGDRRRLPPTRALRSASVMSAGETAQRAASRLYPKKWVGSGAGGVGGIERRSLLLAADHPTAQGGARGGRRTPSEATQPPVAANESLMTCVAVADGTSSRSAQVGAPFVLY